MQFKPAPTFDLSRLRADTPGCRDALFMNSAGASLMPGPVVAAMQEYLQQETALGGYEVERLRADHLARFYQETARLLHTDPEHVAYAYSATDAYARVLSAIPFRAGDVILTTTNDYVSNQLAFLSMQQRLGIRLVRVQNRPTGELDLNHLDELIRLHWPVLVAVSHVPTNSGLVQPAEEIGQLCHQHGVWYLLDAAQSVGQLPVDVGRIRPDFLNATGRKFLRGPRNTGFLYVSDKVLKAGLAPLLIDRRAATWTGADSYRMATGARRFEPQELSLLQVGLAEAVRYANAVGMEAIGQQNRVLMRRLRTGLEQLDGVELTDRGSVQSNILTFHTTRQPLAKLEAALRRQRVVFTVQHPSFAVIDFLEKGIDWVVRLSPHYFNTLEEVDAVVDAVGQALRSD